MEKLKNWEAILNNLEQYGNVSGQPLTEEEQAILNAAREIRMRLKMSGNASLTADQVKQEWMAFQEIVARLDQKSENPGPKTRTVFARYWKFALAACITGVVAVAGYKYFVQQKNTAKPVVASVNKAILPPTGSVTLTLSDGRKLMVNNQKQTAHDAGGVHIKTGGAGLEYQADANGSSKNQPVAYNTVDVPRGFQTKVILSDGTVVWINADSRLSYPVSFTGNSREVTLEGEAYFEVKQHKHQPFIVHAAQMQVRVLGTGFNINTHQPVLYATLVHGKVNVRTDNNVVLLSPGEQAAVNAQNLTINVKPVETSGITAWKDGIIYFDDQTLLQITRSLERIFDYTFVIDEDELAALRFTLELHKPKDLQEVLDKLTATIGTIRFTTNNRVVHVNKPNH